MSALHPKVLPSLSSQKSLLSKIVFDFSHFQIRDGDQGYSTLIDKYCGNNFPPIITSSGRSLWLRFVSDGTIEYSGFKAVYEFIPNPMEIIPFIPKCEFEIGGAMDFIGKDKTQNYPLVNWKPLGFQNLQHLSMRYYLSVMFSQLYDLAHLINFYPHREKSLDTTGQ